MLRGIVDVSRSREVMGKIARGIAGRSLTASKRVLRAKEISA